MVDRAFGAIGSVCVRFRWVVLILWIAGAVLASTQLPALSSVTQSDNAKFLPESAPSQHATDLAEPFGNAQYFPIPVLVARSGTQLTAADQTAIDAVQAKLRAVKGVVKVQDTGRSADGQAEQLQAYIPGASGDQNALIMLVKDMRAAITAADLPSGMEAHLAGEIAVSVDQAAANGNQGGQVEIFSILFIIVLLVLIFRSLSLSLTTLAPSFISVAIAGPLVAEAAQHGLQVSPLAQFLLIVLVLGAGTDYGLFLVFRVREELRAGTHEEGGSRFPGATGLGGSLLRDVLHPRPPAQAAIVRSVTKVGESIAASAGTVILAMFTLLLASFPFYSDLGLPFAIAIAVTLVAGLTLLPALLSIRLSVMAIKRSLFMAAFHRPRLVPFSIQGSGGPGIWGAIAGRIVRRPLATLIAGVVMFGGLAVFVLGYTSSGFGGDTSAPKGSDSAAGQGLLDTHFPRAAVNPTVALFTLPSPVWSDPAPVAAATSQLSADPQFTRVTGPLNPAGPAITGAEYTRLHDLLGPAEKLPPVAAGNVGVSPGEYQMYRATASFVSPDGRTVQFSTGLKAGDPSTTEAMRAVPAVRDSVTKVQHAIGATDSGVAGQAPALFDISDISGHDLVKIIPIAIIAIGILLALVLRSLVAPVYLIASVALSYLAALGLSVLVFIKIADHGGLVFFMPFLMFIFLLALGEDYNILIMTRIREEAHHLPLKDAVTKALSTTGTTITSAGLVLAGTFFVLTVVAGSGSGAAQIRDMGLGLTFGILMDTFLVRTLLVPSTVVLLGRWNWWPSTLGREPEEAVEPPAPERVPV